MNILKIAILGAALLSPATSFAAYIPAGAADLKESLMTTVIQEVEGYPSPVAVQGNCVEVRQAMSDAHGKFMGYHMSYICR